MYSRKESSGHLSNLIDILKEHNSIYSVELVNKSTDLINEYSQINDSIYINENTDLPTKYLIPVGSENLSITLDKNKSHNNELLTLLKVINEKIKLESPTEYNNTEVEEALRVKSEFLATMSHEVRTPINAIYGMTTLLLNEIQKPSHVKKLNIITESCEHLLNLVNDILDYSKMDSHKYTIELQAFNLEDSMNQMVQFFEDKSVEKGLSLRLKILNDIPKYIKTDLTKFRQIVLNLLSNSLKFTESGKIELSCRRDENKIFISVKDTGIGIDDKKIEELFMPFQQANNTISRKFGGTGLGLAISKKLAEILGGDIKCESNEGVGSCFTFSITFEEVSSNDPIIAEEISAEKGRKRNTKIPNIQKEYPLSILVAEDNMANQVFARSVFKELGYTIDIASNGIETLEMIGIKKYDLIFMDMQMPEMNGLQATRIIVKTMKERPKIIAMTANALARDRQECLEAGMDDYISKPVYVEQIIQKIQNNFSKMNIDNENTQYENYLEKPKVFNPLMSANYADLTTETGVDLFEYICTKYLTEFQETIEKMYNRATTNEERHRIAHTLKSNSLSIGADYLASIFEEIEMSTFDDVLPEIQIIEESFEDLLKKIPANLLKIYNSAKL